MMNEPVQKLLLALGNFGCLFLSIVRAAEIITSKALNELVIFVECSRKTEIVSGARKAWIDADCYVNFPASIFGYLVGGSWVYTKEDIAYTPVTGDIVILRYEWQKTPTSTSTHFCLGDLNKQCIYDPMGDSLTRANGKLVGLRILRRAS